VKCTEMLISISSWCEVYRNVNQHKLVVWSVQKC